MKKTIFASADVGNKNLNVYMDGMKEPLVLVNALCDVTSLNAETSLGFFQRQLSPVNLLDVSIISNGKDLGRKYVAGMAVKHGGEVRPLGKPKYNDNDIFFSALTGLAFALVTPGVNTERRLNLGSCLPVAEYLQESKVKAHEARFLGKHTVQFNHPYFKGAKVTLDILDNSQVTFPEGSAALVNIMTDKDGQLLDEYKNLEDRIYIVVDIGGATVDITAVMNFEPVEELTTFLDKGILYAEERIIETLKKARMSENKPEYVISKIDLDYYIRKKDCQLIDGEGTWDVSEYVTQEFKSFSKEIAQKINDLIRKMPDGLKKNIARIVLTGGTTLLISDYITSEIPSYYKVYSSPSSLNDNVLGCYKVIKAKSAEREQSSGEEEIYKAVNKD